MFYANYTDVVSQKTWLLTIAEEVLAGLASRISAMLGVTVVICCHNSAERLPRTLACLAAQQVRPELPWEVMVIDNASNDDTANVALTSWPSNIHAPLRIVNEPKLGLTYARCRGLDSAKHEVVSFVDDDNWVHPKWVETAANVMSMRPRVGACGGQSEAKCEINPPWWFDLYQEYYAVGAQSDHQGDITWLRGYIWGAGLTVRKAAWRHLKNLGFRFLLGDREGSTLQSGGDIELCLALRLAGWTLWYEPQLQLIHYLPKCRLNWIYLRNLVRQCGSASIVHRAYTPRNLRTAKSRLESSWLLQAMISFIKLIASCRQLLLKSPHTWEGNAAVLDMESRIGELQHISYGPIRFHNIRRTVNTTFAVSQTGPGSLTPESLNHSLAQD